MKFLSRISLIIVCICCGGFGHALCARGQNEAEGQTKALTLHEALLRVFEANPRLAASELEIQAAAARISQAGLRPNPEFEAEFQNLPALGSSDLFRSTEVEFLISHRWETGGKRNLRVQAAAKEKDIAGRALELIRTDLIASARQAFADVLADQQRLANSRELARLAQKSHSIVVDRVAAGKVSPVEQVRSLASLADIELEEEKQEQELIASKDTLSALWGGTSLDFEYVEAHFEIPPLLEEPLAEPLAEAEGCKEISPDIKLADATVEFHRSALALEKALRNPDLTFTAGYRRSNPESFNAWIAGVSIPLPIFDKRQGAIAEARIRLEKASLEKKNIERNLRSALAKTRHSYDIAVLESTALAKTVLPAASDALRSTEEGYRLGKFEYVSVVDAQRTYAQLQRRHIEAIVSGLKAAIEIDRLGGCGFPNVPTMEVSNEK